MCELSKVTLINNLYSDPSNLWNNVQVLLVQSFWMLQRTSSAVKVIVGCELVNIFSCWSFVLHEKNPFSRHISSGALEINEELFSLRQPKEEAQKVAPKGSQKTSSAKQKSASDHRTFPLSRGAERWDFRTKPKFINTIPLHLTHHWKVLIFSVVTEISHP